MSSTVKLALFVLAGVVVVLAVFLLIGRLQNADDTTDSDNSNVTKTSQGWIAPVPIS